MAGHDLPDRLGTWVDAGLVSQDQADAIQAFEAERHHEGVPRWVEPVAYLGAALVAVALFLLGSEVWDRLATWGQISLAAVITLILLGTGLVLKRSDAPPARRAAGFSWFLSVAGITATAGLVAYSALDLSEESAFLLTAGSAFVGALVLYLLSRTGIQMVALGVGTAALIFTLPVYFELSEPWMVGLTFFAVGLIWLLLTWGDILRPETVGWVLGGIFSLAVGFGGVDDGSGLWSGIGVAAGLGLVYLSTVVDLRSLLVIGVVGLLAWIPTTVVAIFGEGTIVVPIAILITGVVTLTVVLAAVRMGRRADPPEEVTAPERETTDA